jgi:hypothetical protein
MKTVPVWEGESLEETLARCEPRLSLLICESLWDEVFADPHGAFDELSPY